MGREGEGEKLVRSFIKGVSNRDLVSEARFGFAGFKGADRCANLTWYKMID